MRFLFFLTFFLFFPLYIFSQSETEIAKKAEETFQKNDFETARKEYLNLLSLQPKNFLYNYYYGISLLNSTGQAEEAVKYLKYASTSPETPADVYFYLGKAYHLDYRFKDAIRYYQIFQSKAGNTSNNVALSIQMCKNAQEIFQRPLTDLTVLDKREYIAGEFFRVYDEKQLDGSILVSKIDQSKVDKKKNFTPVIFYPNNSNVIYFSSYGTKDSGQKDIYYKVRSEGKWGEAKLIEGSVNTPFDEDFPYFDAINNILYFSSKGHNSMGGYDVFKATYHPETKQFDSVENVGFAISSTYDDLFFIPSTDNTVAWFASNRECKQGKLTIFQVEMQTRPTQIAFVKGDFSSEVFPDLKSVKIEVKSPADLSIVIFHTDEEGDFDIPVYSSGDYNYRVFIRQLGKTFDLNFNLPHLENRTEYQQKIIHKRVGDKDFLELVLIGSQPIAEDDERYLASIKEKSTLKITDKKAIQQSEAKDEIVALTKRFQEAIEKVEASETTVRKVNQRIINNVSEAERLKKELKNFVADHDLNQLSVAETDEAKAKLDRLEEVETENQRLLSVSDSIMKQLEDGKINSDQFRELNRAIQLIPEQDVDSLKRFKTKNALAIQQMQIFSSQQNTDSFERQSSVKRQLAEATDQINAVESEKKVAQTELANLEDKRLVAKPKELPEIEKLVERQKEKIASQEKLSALLIEKKTQLEVAKQRLEKENNFWVSIQQVASDKNHSKGEIEAIIRKNSDPNFGAIKKLINSLTTTSEESDTTNNVDETVRKQDSKENPTSTKIFLEQELDTLLQALDQMRKTDSSEKVRDAYQLLLQKINVHEKAQQKLLTDTPNDKDLLKQQVELVKRKEQLKNEQAVWEENLIHQTVTVPSEIKDQKEWIHTIDTSYEAKLAAINANENYSYKWQKIQELIQSEQNLLKKVQQESAMETSDTLQLLAKNIELSVVQLKKQLEFEKQSTIDNALTTSDNLRKAITQLELEHPESVFNEEATDLEMTISRQRKALLVLKESFSEDSLLLLKINDKLDELIQTDVLLEEKRAEYRQLQEEKIREQNSEEVIVIDVHKDSSENASPLQIEKMKVHDFVTNVLPTLQQNNRLSLQAETKEKGQAILKQQHDSVDVYLSKATEIQKLIPDDEEIKAFVTRLQQTKENLQETMSQIMDEPTSPSDTLQAVEPVKVEAEYEQKQQDLVASIDSSYRMEKDAILKRNDLDDWEKTTQLLDNDKKLLQKFQHYLTKNPSTQPAIEQLISSLQDSIAFRETKVAKEWTHQLTGIEKQIESLMSRKETLLKNSDSITSMVEINETTHEISHLQAEIKTLRKKVQTDEKKTRELDAMNATLQLLLQDIAEITSKNKTNPVDSIVDLTVAKPDALVDTTAQLTIKPTEQTTSLPSEVHSRLAGDFTFVANTESNPTTDSSQSNSIVTNQPKLDATENTTENRVLNSTKTKNNENITQNQLHLSDSVSSFEKKEITLVPDTSNPSVSKEIPIEKEKSAPVANLSSSEEQLVAFERKVKTEVQNVELKAALQKDSVLMTEITKQKETLTRTTNEYIPKEKQAIDVNLLQSQLEKSILSDDKKSTFKQTIVTIQQIEKKETSLSKMVQTEKEWIQNEIEESDKKQLIFGENDEELKSYYLENQLEYLKNLQLQTVSDIQLLKDTDSKHHRIKPKTIRQMSQLLNERAIELADEITWTKNELERLPAEENRQKFYQLEEVLINGKKVNANQLVNYQLLSHQYRQLDTLNALQQQFIQSVFSKEPSQRDTDNLKRMSQLKSELKIQIANNQQILIAEIEHPSLTVSTKQNLPTLKQEVENQSFTIRKQNNILPNVNTNDLQQTLQQNDYPKGLCFRVQVGAFAKPIDENVYSAFSPVTMEKLNGNLIKYMAGYFTEEQKAIHAREEIRTIGFKDAFVVAYCDGVRIPVFEARRRLAEKTCIPVSDSALFVHIHKNQLENKNLQTMDMETIRQQVAVQNVENTRGKKSNLTSGYVIDEQNSTDIRTIPDLFFTVQIGVFGRYVEIEYLKGLKPMTTFEVQPNAIRYSVGIFDNMDSAKTQRLKAIEAGFKDAFIVAYSNGVRYMANQAVQLLAEGKATIIQLKSTEVPPDSLAIHSSHDDRVMGEDFSAELKTIVSKNVQERTTTNFSDTGENVENSSDEVVLSFVFSKMPVDLAFYWWMTSQFTSYSFLVSNQKIILQVVCNRLKVSDIKKSFSDLNFNTIQMVEAIRP